MLTLHRIADHPWLLWAVLLLAVMAGGAFLMVWVERRRNRTGCGVTMHYFHVPSPRDVIHFGPRQICPAVARMWGDRLVPNPFGYRDAYNRRPARRMPRVRYRATRTARPMAAEISA